MPITTEPKGPKPHIAGAYKVQVIFQNTTDPARRAANVFHVNQLTVAPPTVAQLNSYAASFSSAYATALAGVLGTTWKIISCVVTALDGSGLQGTDNTSHTGTASTPAMPPGNAVTVSWTAVGQSWRGGRARTYIPGVTSGCLVNPDDSAITVSFANALVSQMKTFLNAVIALNLNGVQTNLVLVSYFSKGAFRSPPLTAQILAPLVHQRVSSQRRRSGKEATFGVSS